MYMPAVKLFACLEVYAYLISNENPNFSSQPTVNPMLFSGLLVSELPQHVGVVHFFIHINGVADSASMI